ncbi:MAG TPA: hypothetical protein DG761_02685 [Gammaproteobacteria bacterium]|nr:hypothetical protein [Acidiferrobacteraceae bacterium]MDP6552277.1 ATP-binding protein [Arenicellales bacterium]MDP6790436.1 ATP-binding protein [Arenicellales bacterium]HCX86909.1 hypothetical protein [Gammaproteobacteria bacterium]
MNSLVGPRSVKAPLDSAVTSGSARIRPGLKIRTKLLLLVILLLAIPWMGYESVREMEKFLLEGQEQALELTTQGISSILGNRTDLFDPGVGVPELIGRPLTSLLAEIAEPLAIDAPADSWATAVGALTHFSGSGLFECGSDYQPESLVVRHGLAIDPDSVFAYFEIDDDVLVLRDPALLSLDANDQIRMTVQKNNGEILRYLLTAQAPGRLSVYLMRANWKDVVDGEALREIAGTIDPVEYGYAVKVRIPRELLGVGARLKFEVVDVDDQSDRAIGRIISTEPDPRSHAFGSVRLVTPELAKLIQPLYISEANISVWDKSYRVRAQIGSVVPPAREAFGIAQPNATSLFQRVEDQLIRFFDWILRSPARGLADMPADSSAEDQRILARVLSGGEPNTERRRYGDAKLIVTAAPIWAQGEIEGAVLVKQSANKLLALQYETLQRFTILFLAVFIFLSLAILIFSTRLTYRVGRLQRETEQAASSEGRLLKDRIRAGARSSDELGNLTRSISLMLHNLGQYTRYLEKLPDTLAHELHNPLNVVNSSLENLQYNHRELTDDKHLQRARNGIGRLRSIITSLTEAASLKEALSQEQEQLERFNLCALVQNCVEGYQSANPGYRIVPTLAPGSAWMLGVPDRIAQLLDKLIDNAIAFGTHNGLIVVNVRRVAGEIELTVSNDGPTLPNEIADRLFDPMVSSARDARKTHLGLGLYIARLVVEFHKGTVAARNRRGGAGVELIVTLPMIPAP